MRSKISAVAIGLVVAAFHIDVTPAFARLGGPANLPPAGFGGQQFIDANGCLFLRAGIGAQTVWVPMIDGNRKQICGMAPTFGGAAAPAIAMAEPEPAPAPAPAPVAKAAPVMVAPAPQPVIAAPVIAAPVMAPPPVVAAAAPAPARQAAPPQGYQTVSVGAVTARCFANSPVLERVVLRNGGTALVCTAGDGTLNNWRSPEFPANAGFGAALGYTPATQANMRGARVATATSVQTAAAAVPKAPKGWRQAWKDDRLNPLRGVGTAEGQAQQDQVWTRDVPAQPVVVAKAAPVAAAAPVTRMSTMSAPATGTLYVQIGSFGVASNAEGASARTAALGLPVSKSQITRSGKVLQVVYAGPFATSAEAQAALQALKAAGFTDAILR
jgi:SPOR domain